LESIHCRRSPENSYALYLPSTYTPTKQWPIIYAFDPGAQGEIPVRMYKDVAEKYGYIIAASNDSQNFNPRAQSVGTREMIQDTLDRFAIDLKRVYTTGFSGGARVATSIAINCSERCSVAGVVASGATYPPEKSPSPKDSFLYFVGLGDTDFNYPETIKLQFVKEQLGSPYRIRFFPGPHQWSPADVFEEAIAWFQLRAMQEHTIPQDKAFIQDQLASVIREYENARESHDALRQFFALKSLVEDFKGLREVSEYERRLHDVKASADLKKTFDNERKQAEKQRDLEDEVARAVAQFSQPDVSSDQRMQLRSSIIAGMERLKKDGQTSKDEVQRKVHQRAFNALFAVIAEDGQIRQAAGKFKDALPYYEILQEAAPERAWPDLLVAESRLALGDKKRAIQAIERAVATGRVDAAALRDDRKLAPLFSDPDFKWILDRLRK
jgi:predicted esterase